MIAAIGSALVAALALAGGMSSSGKAHEHRYVVALPKIEADGARGILVLADVRLPGNVPLKLVVVTFDERNREVRLGSLGVEALGPTSNDEHKISDLRLDVTESLPALRGTAARAGSVDIELRAVDARGRALSGIVWSVGRVRIERVGPAGSGAPR